MPPQNPEQPPQMSAVEFAQTIKKQYPQYNSWNDRELTNAMLEKYPQYKSWIKTGPTDYVVEGTKGLYEGLKSAFLFPIHAASSIKPEEQQRFPKDPNSIVPDPNKPGGFVTRIADRAIRQPLRQFEEGAEARRASAASGENWAGQALSALEKYPLIGGAVKRMEQSGPGYIKMSPQALRGATEAIGMYLGPEAMKRTVKGGAEAGGMAWDAYATPERAAQWRQKSAELYTKSVRPTKETQALIDSKDPAAIGRGISAEKIVTRLKNYGTKLAAVVDRNVQKMRDMEAQLESRGYTMDVGQQFDRAISEAIANTRDVRARNALQQFADRMKYNLTQDKNGNWVVDYNRPRDLTQMKPSEIREFIQDLDKPGYENYAQDAVRDAAKRARYLVASEMGKNIPGYTQLGKDTQAQIAGIQSLSERYASKLRGAKEGLMRTVFEAGVVPIAIYEMLKTVGAGTGVAAGAYPSALALVKAATSTPSLTVRGAYYRMLADMLDPQKVSGTWPSGPTPPPRTAPSQGPAPGTPAPGGGPAQAGTPFPQAGLGRGTPVQPQGGPATSGGNAPQPAGTAWPPKHGPYNVVDDSPTPGRVSVDKGDSVVVGGVSKEVNPKGAEAVGASQRKASGEAPKRRKYSSVEEAKAAHKEQKRARQEQVRAEFKGTVRAQAEAALAESGGVGKLVQGVSTAMNPQQHMEFMEVASERLKQLDPGLFETFDAAMKDYGKNLSPEDQRAFVAGLVQQVMEPGAPPIQTPAPKAAPKAKPTEAAPAAAKPKIEIPDKPPQVDVQQTSKQAKVVGEGPKGGPKAKAPTVEKLNEKIAKLNELEDKVVAAVRKSNNPEVQAKLASKLAEIAQEREKYTKQARELIGKGEPEGPKVNPSEAPASEEGGEPARILRDNQKAETTAIDIRAEGAISKHLGEFKGQDLKIQSPTSAYVVMRILGQFREAINSLKHEPMVSGPDTHLLQEFNRKYAEDIKARVNDILKDVPTDREAQKALSESKSLDELQKWLAPKIKQLLEKKPDAWTLGERGQTSSYTVSSDRPKINLRGGLDHMPEEPLIFKERVESPKVNYMYRTRIQGVKDVIGQLRTGRDGRPIMYLGNAALEYFYKALYPGRPAPGGFYASRDSMADFLVKAREQAIKADSPNIRSWWQSVSDMWSDAMLKVANAGDNGIAMVAEPHGGPRTGSMGHTRGALQEETAHRWQGQFDPAGKGRTQMAMPWSNFVMMGDLIREKMPNTVSALPTEHYGNVSEPSISGSVTLTTEVTAKIIANSLPRRGFARLGLKEDSFEAQAQVLESYFDTLRANHGDKAVDAVKTLVTHTKVAEKAKRTWLANQAIRLYKVWEEGGTPLLMLALMIGGGQDK